MGSVPFPRQRHWAQRGEDFMTPAAGSPRALCCDWGSRASLLRGTRGRQHLLMNHKDPECCRLIVSSRQRGGPPELAGSNPKGLEGWDGLTSLPGLRKQQSLCGPASGRRSDEAVSGAGGRDRSRRAARRLAPGACAPSPRPCSAPARDVLARGARARGLRCSWLCWRAGEAVAG